MLLSLIRHPNVTNPVVGAPPTSFHLPISTFLKVLLHSVLPALGQFACGPRGVENKQRLIKIHLSKLNGSSLVRRDNRLPVLVRGGRWCTGFVGVAYLADLL